VRVRPVGQTGRVGGTGQATSTALPVLGGLVAALLFAVANNVQRHAAQSVPQGHVGPVGLLLRLLRNRRWLAGSSSAVLALLVQAWALSQGGVILVQAVIASTLVFSLAMESVVERRWPIPSQIVGAVLVAVGISVLVLVGKPGAGGEFHSLGRAAVVWGVLAVVGGGALLTSHRRPRGRRTAIVMGSAAGVCFALDAVFLRGLTATLSPPETIGLLINLAGFAVASVLGNLVIQRSFQMAPLRHVLPAMAAAEPVTAFLCARYVFGERLQSGPSGALGVGGGLFLMVCGVVLCAIGRVQPAPGKAPAKLAAARPAARVSRTGSTRYEPPTPALPYLPPFARAATRPDHVADGDGSGEHPMPADDDATADDARVEGVRAGDARAGEARRPSR
jgi:drug/metabolite transporter (DMT)-like permease